MKNSATQKNFDNIFAKRNLSFLLLFLCLGSFSYGQNKSITVSGHIIDGSTKFQIAYATIAITKKSDGTAIAGSLSDENGRFSLSGIPSGNYTVAISMMGYLTKEQTFYAGTLSDFLNLNTIELAPDSKTLDEVVITSEGTKTVSDKMDKKTFSLADNIAQTGGSVLQSMQNLPGITVLDGKVQLRGNDKVMILIDGKQTALTGFGN